MKRLFHYAYSGLRSCEIGKLKGLDYSTVIVRRKRLEKLNNASLQDLVRRNKYNL